MELIIAPQIPQAPALALTEEALTVRADLLQKATALEGLIATDAHRDQAINVAAKIRARLKEMEASRVALKKPFLDVSIQIDTLAKDYRQKLEAELTRINAIIGIYEDQREKKLKDEEETIEQEKLRLAKEATKDAAPDATPEDRAKAVERAFEAEEGIEAAEAKIAKLRASGDANKATGGALRKDWDIEVTDIKALWLAHPQCVEMLPRLLAIKDLLKIGIIPIGVKATPRTTYATRAAK